MLTQKGNTIHSVSCDIWCWLCDGWCLLSEVWCISCNVMGVWCVLWMLGSASKETGGLKGEHCGNFNSIWMRWLEGGKSTALEITFSNRPIKTGFIHWKKQKMAGHTKFPTRSGCKNVYLVFYFFATVWCKFGFFLTSGVKITIFFIFKTQEKVKEKCTARL